MSTACDYCQLGHPLPSDKIRLVKNFLWLISLRGLEFLIPLVTIPYLLRTIGVEKYGLIGFGYAFAAYFGAIVQYGFGVTATRDIARNQNDPREVGRLFSIVIAASASLVILSSSSAVLILLASAKLRDEWPLHVVSLAQVMLQSLFPIWFFQGIERMAFITYLNLVAKVAFIAGLFLLVRGPSDYLYVPLLNCGSAALLLVSSMWIVACIFHVPLNLPSWAAVRNALVDGRHAFVNQLAPTLYNNSSTFLLGLVSGTHAVGLYSAATKVVDAVSSLGYILSNTFLPHLSRSLLNHHAFKKIMLLAGGSATLFLFLAADVIGRLLHPSEGPAIAQLLRFASVSVVFIFAMLAFGTNYLMLMDKDAISGRISLYTSLAFFFVGVVLIPAYGIIGSIATVVGARLCMASLIYLSYRQILRPDDQTKHLL